MIYCSLNLASNVVSVCTGINVFFICFLLFFTENAYQKHFWKLFTPFFVLQILNLIFFFRRTRSETSNSYFGLEDLPELRKLDLNLQPYIEVRYFTQNNKPVKMYQTPDVCFVEKNGVLQSFLIPKSPSYEEIFLNSFVRNKYEDYTLSQKGDLYWVCFKGKLKVFRKGNLCFFFEESSLKIHIAEKEGIIFSLAGIKYINSTTEILFPPYPD